MTRQQKRKAERETVAAAERNLAILTDEKNYRWGEVLRIKREYDAMPFVEQLLKKAELAEQIDQHLAAITG